MPGCGWDTSYYAADWRGVSPIVEIVTCDLTALTTRSPKPIPAPPTPDGSGVQLTLLGS